MEKKKLLHSCCYFKPVDFQSLHIIMSVGMGRKKHLIVELCQTAQCSLQHLTVKRLTEMCLFANEENLNIALGIWKEAHASTMNVDVATVNVMGGMTFV